MQNHAADLEEPLVTEGDDAYDGGSNRDDESETDGDPSTASLCRRPPTNDEATAALDAAVRTQRRKGAGYDYLQLDRVILEPCSVITACLSLYLAYDTLSFIDTSIKAAVAHRRATYVRSIRAWIRRLKSSGDLPQNCWVGGMCLDLRTKIYPVRSSYACKKSVNPHVRRMQLILLRIRRRAGS